MIVIDAEAYLEINEIPFCPSFFFTSIYFYAKASPWRVVFPSVFFKSLLQYAELYPPKMQSAAFDRECAHKN